MAIVVCFVANTYKTCCYHCSHEYLEFILFVRLEDADVLTLTIFYMCHHKNTSTVLLEL